MGAQILIIERRNRDQPENVIKYRQKFLKPNALQILCITGNKQRERERAQDIDDATRRRRIK